MLAGFVPASSPAQEPPPPVSVAEDPAEQSLAEPSRPADDPEELDLEDDPADQEPEPPPPPVTVPPPPVDEPTTEVGDAIPPGISGDQRREVFPSLNLYLPEGEFDIRVRRLVKNVLFEGQVNYNFVDGDVSTFLRYKYYAHTFTYKLGVFDEIEFESIEDRSGDFDRTRGGLLLFEYPKDFDQRYALLLEVDALSFGDISRPDHDKNNNYVKFGVQLGTETDERLNEIAGEQRGRITPILTAYRDIGPHKQSIAAAITHSVESAGSDFQYTKFETEGLKRNDFGSNFLISRLHLGVFFGEERFEDRAALPLEDQFSIPRGELFKVGDRDKLKGVDSRHRGTHELHWTNEYFVPVFREQEKKALGATWTNFYGIGYAGFGTVDFDWDAFTDFNRYIVDLGIGFETSLIVRDYNVLLNAIYATPVTAPDDIDGGEFRFSVRTSR